MRSRALIGWLLGGCCGWAMALALAGPAEAESRVALIIGNGGYKAAPQLANPANDARDVGGALKALGFDAEIVVDADLEHMRAAVANFAKKAAKSDVSLFYYGGHGMQVAQHNFLVPTDAAFRTAEDIETRAYAFDDLMKALAGGSGLRLIFLDACRNSPIQGAPLPAAAQGLAEVGESAGFFIAYATKPNFIAYDGEGRNSPFAQALLGHIATPGVDVSALMIDVRRDVVAATGGEQVPWDSSSLTRQFYFAGATAAAPTPEALLWQAAAREHDRNLLAIYIDRYPKGAHADDARALIADTPHASAAPPRPAADVENDLWRLALSSRQRPLVELYLARYPESARRSDAESLLDALKAAESSAHDPGVLCDQLAAVPADATADAPGVDFATLSAHAGEAVETCRAATAKRPDIVHYQALLARALYAASRFDEAVALYRKAAEGGDARAMTSLALLMEAGDHIPKDVKGAFALYAKAAERGNPDAAINLGYALAQGKFIDKDVNRAYALFKTASEAGSARATYDLAALTESGIGGKPADALALFRLAASQGAPAGHRAAALLLDAGRNAPRDPAAAAKELLACVAADSGECLNELTGRTQIWSAETVKAMQTTLKAANYYSGPTHGRAGPELAPALKQWRLLGPPSG